MASDSAAVDARTLEMPQPQRDTLLALRATLRRVLPHAEECLKYGMPSFTVQGKGVAAYDAFRDHCSYFPFSGGVLDKVGATAVAYVRTKGALRFPVDSRCRWGSSANWSVCAWMRSPMSPTADGSISTPPAR